MKFNKTFLLSLMALPLLVACNSGYMYDNDNVKGHNKYLPQNDSYMIEEHRDTHCNTNVNDCNINQ